MANEISKLITPDGVSHDIRDANANRALYGGAIDSSSSADMKDFNNLLVSNGNIDRVKIYWCNLSAMSNGPASSGYGYLECISTLQRFTFYNTKITHERTYVNQAWSNWVVATNITINDSSTANNVAWSAQKIDGEISTIDNKKVSKSGDTMTGDLKLEGSSQPSVLFKESGYGDKFEIKPSFSGTDESNYLAIKTATGAAGTDPSTSDKIRIRPSGKLEFVNTSRNIEVPARSTSYVDGAKGNAGIYMPHAYNADQWGPIMCVQTKTGGSWSIGNYNNDHLSFVKFTKANIDSNTNTMQCQIDLAETGAVETGNGSFIAKDTSNPASPSSGSLYGKGFYLRDAANDDYAYLRHHYSGAEKGLQIEVRRSINGSYVYNTLNLRINASGGRIVQVSDGAAWRSAIGAQATLSNSDLSYTRVNGNVSNDAKCRRYGNIVEFTGQFGVSSSSLARDTILWNGFPKPKTVVYFTARCEGNWTTYSFYISTNGEIKNQQANIPAGTYNCNLVYICQ